MDDNIVTYCSTPILCTSCSLRENDLKEHTFYSKTKVTQRKMRTENPDAGNPTTRKTKKRREKKTERQKNKRGLPTEPVDRFPIGRSRPMADLLGESSSHNTSKSAPDSKWQFILHILANLKLIQPVLSLSCSS